ncbi:DUF2515 family protein [Desmonostoc muscorum LEGE 12446]|uniref:DUF2515 family protein n=1 Tax=Desmonostoc muscorum LEGE 12446 TaxID=1828758 RepID=A0A8J7DGN6_DESMC|nr:DUF2515 family protein [Desmonostoc muscorum]MCF2146267.1 DUF2515 family protein [Desmonostoc muscorum LEGE 12446]
MDPALWELLGEGDNQDEVAAIIRLKQPGLVPEGVRLVSQFGNIATCRLRRGAILEVRADEAVVSFKAPRLLTTEPEVDVEEVEEILSESASRIDERRPSSEEVTGRGVVVGVVDWGFDFAHPEFCKADGSTRILALWDQRSRPQQKPPYPYSYGVVHTPEAINRALAAKNPYLALGYHPGDIDPGGEGTHGTHVASIAAGNGRGGGPVGIAPDADLVFVHMATIGSENSANLGSSVSLLEAIDFIAKTAGDRPWVINLSMGRHGEQHDGTTLVEQGLDAAVSAAPGRAIIQSAGNYFDRHIHTQGQIRPGEAKTFVWLVDAADVTPNELEVWYSGKDIFAVELHAPNGLLSQRVALGDQANLKIKGQVVGSIYHRGHEPNTLDNQINIFLYPSAPPGAWKVTLIAIDVVDGRFNAWIERDVALPHCQSRFRAEDAVNTCTTGTICNGFRTIAVGAYNSHSSEREIAGFSSAGPTRDGRTKPDLAAPGVSILAAKSAPRRSQAETSLLTRKSGTSMAAPHVTGTVALMFEAAGRPLPIEETRNLLLVSTQKAASEEDLFRIGSGYLDIEKAVDAVRNIGKAKTQPQIEKKLGQFAPSKAAKQSAREDIQAFETRVAQEPSNEVYAVNADVININDTIADFETQAEEPECCGGYEADSEATVTSNQEKFIVENEPIAGVGWREQQGAAMSELRINVVNPDVTDINDAVIDSRYQTDESEWCGGYEADSNAAIANEDIWSATDTQESNGNGKWYKTPSRVENLNLQLVDWADEAIAIEEGDRTSGGVIHQILSKAGIAENLNPTKKGAMLSPAEIFDAFTSKRSPNLRRHLTQFFEVVATPGESLSQSLQAGDLLIRRALGEGKLAHVAVIAESEIRAHEQALTKGLQPEVNHQGWYVQVVEGGSVPHNRAHGFARRLLDSNGRLPYDQLVVRPIHQIDSIATQESVIPSFDFAQETNKRFIIALSNRNVWNLNNPTRTRFYLDYWDRHHEIPWAFLAHLVSRNAGYQMSDLLRYQDYLNLALSFTSPTSIITKPVIDWLEKKLSLPGIGLPLSVALLQQVFRFLEAGNFLIFHDVFPQLIAYEVAKEVFFLTQDVTGSMKAFDYLTGEGVDLQIINQWKQFFTKAIRKSFWQGQPDRVIENDPDVITLTYALIVNEQNYIEDRLLKPIAGIPEYVPFQKPISVLFKISQALELTKLIFPKAKASSPSVPAEFLIHTVGDFNNLQIRIDTGRKLYFSIAIKDPSRGEDIKRWVKTKIHDGSRQNYDPVHYSVKSVAAAALDRKLSSPLIPTGPLPSWPGPPPSTVRTWSTIRPGFGSSLGLLPIDAFVSPEGEIQSGGSSRKPVETVDGKLLSKILF